VGEDYGFPQLDRATISAVLELWKDGRRPFTLRLEGRSMVPLVRPDDRVTIQPVSPDLLRCGDLVAVQAGRNLVVHRFVQSRTGPDGIRRLCQKGDNSPAWSRVDPDAVLGRVTAIHGPERTLQMSCRPWIWINPLAGWLGRLGMLSHRLSRLLLVPLIRLGLRRKK
jgi:hypothetical protein